MSEPMRRQILEQPAVLRSLLQRSDEIASRLTGLSAGIRRVWAVGHGDSYFAPLAASPAFHRWTPRPYAPLLAQEMAAYPPVDLDERALVIVLSISGGVGRSIAAAEVARDRRARVLAITNTPDSPLTKTAHEVILLNIAEPAPFLAGTVTYTACVLTLLMIALLLEDHMTQMPALESAVGALELALGTETAAREWVAPLGAAPVWYILGMDGHAATAQYGAAKMIEVADVVAVAHETEEFFHEHHWVIRGDHPVVLIAHDAASQARSQAAVAHLRELGIPVAFVGPGPAPSGASHFSVAQVEPWCAVLPGAVPLQWLAYWLARVKGLDPDRRSHLRDSARYTVSRKYR
ncbi:MAG: SIS domain-containing protein [Armatimonadota bacterium]